MSKCACHLTDRITGEAYEIKDASARQLLATLREAVDNIKKTLDTFTGVDEETWSRLVGLGDEIDKLAVDLDSKVTSLGANDDARVYCVSKEGKNIAVAYSQRPRAGTIVQRDAEGRITSASPEKNDEVTPKKYVDELISEINSAIESINTSINTINAWKNNHIESTSELIKFVNEINTKATEIGWRVSDVEDSFPKWSRTYNPDKPVLGIAIHNMYGFSYSNGRVLVPFSPGRYYVDGDQGVTFYCYEYVNGTGDTAYMQLVKFFPSVFDENGKLTTAHISHIDLQTGILRVNDVSITNFYSSPYNPEDTGTLTNNFVYEYYQ